MNAILGKIKEVKKLKNSGKKLQHVEISLKPVCLLPKRKNVPEWLKDQTLKITREVADMREIGGEGESIVLSTNESLKYIYPLTVEPSVVYGKLPEKINLTLRWWKDDKPSEVVASANGKQKRYSFVKKGEAFSASINPKDFFDKSPTLPAELKISFDKITVGCTIFADKESGYAKIQTINGERHRLESDWYSMEVRASEYGGGISMLLEKGRQKDHFSINDNLINDFFEESGHIDMVKTGPEWVHDWNNIMVGTAMTSSAFKSEDDTFRLTLDGVVDEAKNTKTSVSYTMFDRLPMVIIQRDFFIHKQKKKDEKPDEKPSELIDKVMAAALNFRGAYAIEREADKGSRILSVDGDRFSIMRSILPNYDFKGWQLKEGWVIMQHPCRKESMMYLFDKKNAPKLFNWIGDNFITVEGVWNAAPLLPEQGIGYSIAMTAGELCGADTNGAWIATRRLTDSGIECAVIARFKDTDKDKTADITLGKEIISVPFKKITITGIGEISTAKAIFPKGKMNSLFDVVAGSIPARS